MTILAVALLGLEAGLIVAVVASVGFFVAGVSKVNLVISREPALERIAVSGNLFYASLDRLSNHLRCRPHRAHPPRLEPGVLLRFRGAEHDRGDPG